MCKYHSLINNQMFKLSSSGPHSFLRTQQSAIIESKQGSLSKYFFVLSNQIGMPQRLPSVCKLVVLYSNNT